MQKRINKGDFKIGHIPWHKGRKNIYSLEVIKKMSIAKKGKTPWNKGKKLGKQSLEIIEKRRQGMLGRKKSFEYRQNMSRQRTGENNPAWKGGVTPIHERIRGSVEYKLWRKAIYERDKYTCIWCGDAKGGNLEADHIKPFAFYPELRFAIDNGRTLCKECHRKTDTYGWSGYHKYIKNHGNKN